MIERPVNLRPADGRQTPLRLASPRPTLPCPSPSLELPRSVRNMKRVGPAAAQEMKCGMKVSIYDWRAAASARQRGRLDRWGDCRSKEIKKIGKAAMSCADSSLFIASRRRKAPLYLGVFLILDCSVDVFAVLSRRCAAFSYMTPVPPPAVHIDPLLSQFIYLFLFHSL